MGVINVSFNGSFDVGKMGAEFPAFAHGHAAAVEQAIRWLTEDILPKAVDQDVRQGKAGDYPMQGFGPTVRTKLLEERR